MKASSWKIPKLKSVTFFGSLVALSLCCLDILPFPEYLSQYRKLGDQPSLPFRRFYTCSPNKLNLRLIQAIFPGLPAPIGLHYHKDVSLLTTPKLKDANEHDLLLANWLDADDCIKEGVLNFPGTQIYINKEPYDFGSGSNTPISQTGQITFPHWTVQREHLIVNGMSIQPVASNQKALEESGYFDYVPHSSHEYFILGAHADGSHNIRVYLGPLLLVASPLEEHKDLIFNHELKPRNSGEYFAIFLSHHCVYFRDRA
eukprot:15365692-Ditylum_brightwellii.AAC.2